MPSVQWYRDDVLMAGEPFTTAQQRSVQSEITVGPLGRQDLNTRLTCRAINHPRALPVESTVLLDMNCEYTAECQPAHGMDIPFASERRGRSVEMMEMASGVQARITHTRTRAHACTH